MLRASTATGHCATLLSGGGISRCRARRGFATGEEERRVSTPAGGAPSLLEFGRAPVEQRVRVDAHDSAQPAVLSDVSLLVAHVHVAARWAPPAGSPRRFIRFVTGDHFGVALDRPPRGGGRALPARKIRLVGSRAQVLHPDARAERPDVHCPAHPTGTIRARGGECRPVHWFRRRRSSPGTWSSSRCAGTLPIVKGLSPLGVAKGADCRTVRPRMGRHCAS